MIHTVCIQSVSGGTCIDTMGNRLIIAGNAYVAPGAYVWTDGRIVYGHEQAGDTPYIPVPTVGIIVAAKMDSKYNDDYTIYEINKIGVCKKLFSDPSDQNISCFLARNNKAYACIKGIFYDVITGKNLGKFEHKDACIDDNGNLLIAACSDYYNIPTYSYTYSYETPALKTSGVWVKDSNTVTYNGKANQSQGYIKIYKNGVLMKETSLAIPDENTALTMANSYNTGKGSSFMTGSESIIYNFRLHRDGTCSYSVHSSATAHASIAVSLGSKSYNDAPATAEVLEFKIISHDSIVYSSKNESLAFSMPPVIDIGNYPSSGSDEYVEKVVGSSSGYTTFLPMEDGTYEKVLVIANGSYPPSNNCGGSDAEATPGYVAGYRYENFFNKLWNKFGCTPAIVPSTNSSFSYNVPYLSDCEDGFSVKVNDTSSSKAVYYDGKEIMSLSGFDYGTADAKFNACFINNGIIFQPSSGLGTYLFRDGAIAQKTGWCANYRVYHSKNMSIIKQKLKYLIKMMGAS